jgi:rod shape-determining protein MreD
VNNTLWLHLDTLARRLSPALLGVLLTMAQVVPLDISGLGAAAPAWPLMTVYFWTLHRPDLMPASAAFAIGLVNDALTGAPIGLNALVFVLLHFFVAGQRRFLVGKPFTIQWLGFALAVATAVACLGLIVCLWYQRLVDVRPLLLHALVTVGFYPVLASAMTAWQRNGLQDL